MKYTVRSAFFLRDFSPSDSDQDAANKMIGVLTTASDNAAVQVFVVLSGPPNASDTASLGVRFENGRHTVIGPEHFSFDSSGTVRLAFFLHQMPLNYVGSVSAQILFAGEQQATPVCSIQIRPKPDSTDLPTIH